MQSQATAIPDVLIIEPKVFGDVRGVCHGDALVATKQKSSDKGGYGQVAEQVS